MRPGMTDAGPRTCGPKSALDAGTAAAVTVSQMRTPAENLASSAGTETSLSHCSGSIWGAEAGCGGGLCVLV